MRVAPKNILRKYHDDDEIEEVLVIEANCLLNYPHCMAIKPCKEVCRLKARACERIGSYEAASHGTETHSNF